MNLHFLKHSISFIDEIIEKSDLEEYDFDVSLSETEYQDKISYECFPLNCYFSFILFDDELEYCFNSNQDSFGTSDYLFYSLYVKEMISQMKQESLQNPSESIG